MNADKIYLVGFMGAGKTTVARALARRLGWNIFDVDDAIEKREHQTVATLFAKRGEPYFRAVEREILLEQVGVRHVVVATGGGTFVDPQNRSVINADGVSVWLDVPFEHVVARVPADGRRPLAADRDAFERLFLARRSAYEQARYRIDAAHGNVESVAEQILDRLEREDREPGPL